VDCADSDCTNDPACQNETICNDGIDNDNDGNIDCGDSDCTATPACSCSPTGGFTEAADATNDLYETGGAAETTGLTFDPAGTTAITIGGCIDPAQVTANVADADFYEFNVSAAGLVRVVLQTTQVPASDLHVILYDPGTGNPLDIGSTTTLDDAVIVGFDMPVAAALWLAVVQDLPAGTTTYTYTVTITQYPHTCVPLTGTPDFTEAGDGGTHRDNDMATVVWSPAFAIDPTTATTDAPESSGITTAAGTDYLITGVSANVTSPGDEYYDRDTYEFTTGATTNEVAIFVSWADTNNTDLDVILFPANDFTEANIVGGGTTIGTTDDEVIRALVQPNTTYWLWVGTYTDAGVTLPVNYDVTICAFQ
jgi:hypothetical protein